MKKLVLIGVGIAAFATTAMAADLPVKAPTVAPPPPPAWSWTGFYIGANVGGSIGRVPTSIFDGTALVATQTLSPSGFIGGGQIGYNYQFARHWVIGVEGDFQGASQKDSSCVGACGAGFGTVVTVDHKLDWFATARARFGYTGSPYLIYVTGGGAWAHVKNDLRVSGGVPATDFDLSGWTVGGGIEVHLGGGWTGKLEYLYLDLGSFTDVATSIPPFITVMQTSDVRDHIVRVGLNYKFY